MQGYKREYKKNYLGRIDDYSLSLSLSLSSS